MHAAASQEGQRIENFAHTSTKMALHSFLATQFVNEHIGGHYLCLRLVLASSPIALLLRLNFPQGILPFFTPSFQLPLLLLEFLIGNVGILTII